jgi:hypothetical protein
MNIQPGQLYTKDGNDFRVHEIREGQVYGVLYASKDRGNVRAELNNFSLRRHDIEKFVAEEPELVDEKGNGKTRSS